LSLLIFFSASTSKVQGATPNRLEESGTAHLGLVRFPDVSKTQIVFVYAGDLWLVPRAGGDAARLTNQPGTKSYPRFSPDGQTIAFTGGLVRFPDHYNAIYTIPVAGGTPNRITHHPGTTTLCSWTPDGQLLFMTDGFSHIFDNDDHARVRQLFTVSAAGGLPHKLPLPYGAHGAISPDGRWLAYTFYAESDTEARKHYFGGFAPDIWLFHLQTHQAKRITNWKGTDTHPMWHDDTVYYVSDAGPEGRLNIWSYDTTTAQRRQLTDFKDFDVKWPSMGPGPNNQGEIAFVSGAGLHLLDLGTQVTRRVEVSLPSERLETRPISVDARKSITNWNLSPDGQQALLEAHGDIWTVRTDKGTARALTKSSGAAERDASWSPDGRRIAYFSDATGEYQLYILNADGNGAPKQLTHLDAGFRHRTVWSPDSRRIAFHDSTGSIYLHSVESGETSKIDRDPLVRSPHLSWSPDSRWLAYARGAEGSRRYTAIWLYDVEANQAHQVTGGFFNDLWPTFDSTGNYLFFVSERGLFAATFDTVDYNNYIYPSNHLLLVVPLRSDIGAPWIPTKDPAAQRENGLTRGIELANFERRALPALRDRGTYGNLAAARDGQLLFSFTSPDGASAIKVLNLKDSREAKSILNDVTDFKVSADGKKLLVRRDKAFACLETVPNQKIEKELRLSGMTVEVDPGAERRQIFNEVWRLYRDCLYDEKMHGVDWPAVRVKYARLLDACGRREDVYEVIREMLGELSCSHMRFLPPDEKDPPPEKTGMLGVDFTLENGAYRIAKIYDGAAFDPLSRSPLRAGVSVSEGDYLLAVNHRALNTKQDPWSAFNGLAGKTGSLTVSKKPVIDQDAREVTVTFLEYEYVVRQRAWVEANRAYVDRQSKGRVGYIYLADTFVYGSREFSRQFNGQMDKEALIIDGRWNEGGHVPLHVIEVLSRSWLMGAYEHRRGAGPSPLPDYIHRGPKCLLTNGVAISGGDGLAYLFRQRGIGKLLGTRTMGSMVGIGPATATFVDGGSTRVPLEGNVDEHGNWIVEGYGVEPDIEVTDNPALMTSGGDPQLDAAIKLLLGEIKGR
jgi:tricorn protease